MAVPFEVVPSPNYPTPDYAAWGKTLGNLGNTYREGQSQRNALANQQMDLDTRRAFQGGVPTLPDGSPNIPEMVKMLAQRGGVTDVMSLMPMWNQQGQTGQVKDVMASLYGGQPGASPASGIPTLPRASAPVNVADYPKPDPTQFPDTPQGHDAYISAYASYDAAQKGLDPTAVAGIADKIAHGEGNNTTGWKSPNLASTVDVKNGQAFSFGDFQENVRDGLGTDARKAGIDPADPKQWQAADRYAIDSMVNGGLGPWKGDAEVNALAQQQRAAGFPPSAGASSTMSPPSARPAAPPTGTQGQPAQSPRDQLRTAMLAQNGEFGQLAPMPGAPSPQGQAAPQQQPLVPQPKNVMGANSAEESIAKIDGAISKLMGNQTPMARAFVNSLEKSREEFVKAISPIRVGDTLVDPRTGKEIYRGEASTERAAKTDAAKAASASSDDQAKDIAEAIKKGEQPPSLVGLSRAGLAGKVRQILAKDNFDYAKAALQYKAAEKQVASLNGPQMTKFAGLAKSVVNTMDEVKALGKELDMSGIPALNSVELAAYIQTQGNTPKGILATNYVEAVNTLKEEFTSLAQGGYAPTESAWKLADQQINGNYGVKQLASSLDEAQRLINLRLAAIPGLSTMGPGAAMPPGNYDYDMATGTFKLRQ